MNFLPINYILNKKYKIEKYIGTSDFSNVYLVLENKNYYAIKECFPPELVIRDSDNSVFTNKNKKKFNLVKENFKKEYEILKKFDDSNIVKLIDFFEENNTVYLVLEYCKGCSLKKYILENNIEQKEIIKLFLKVLEIIKKIHSQNVIHRDIKPTNFLIDGKENIKLIDFGASLVDDEKQGKYIKVTDCYSPLEMYSLEAECDKRTDIYSLCALFYFMLNKHKPMNVLNRFYYPELEFEDSNIDENIRKIIEKGMSMEIKDRFNGCEEILDELKKINI